MALLGLKSLMKLKVSSAKHWVKILTQPRKTTFQKPLKNISYLKLSMSEKSITSKIEFILEMIENIEKIVQRHNGIVDTINDFEGQMAILMGISQIGEILKKLPDDLVLKYDLKEDKEGAYYTRNYIVHDYEGVDLGFIENIIREYLPKLKEKLSNIR